MKVAVITDIHAGVRNDSQVFLDYFSKSYKFFFEYLHKHKIKHVLVLGDVYDRRQFINMYTAYRTRTELLEKLDEFETIVIPGNHDEYFKNTGTVNSWDELVRGYKNIRIVHDPEVVHLGDRNILLVPWITDTNKEATLKAIASTKATIAMGHLDLVGFEEQRGSFSDHGLDASLFKHFTAVYSGHFHHRSVKDNVHYIGAFCEHTWSDWNDPKGFSVFDTTKLTMDFIQNPYTIFNMVQYDDQKGLTDIPNVDNLANSFTRIVVTEKQDLDKFDAFVRKIEAFGPYDISIIEQFVDTDNKAEIVTEYNVDDTLEVTKKYIDATDTQLDKNTLKNMMVDIFKEAQMMETL